MIAALQIRLATRSPVLMRAQSTMAMTDRALAKSAPPVIAANS